ncbi:MAG: hypothetical protein L0Z62_35860 [Gemmataceae bacterium]|nr:hypothetical protein [Gemmataceae bacterium]
MDRQDPDLHDAEKLQKDSPLANYRFAVDPEKSCGVCAHYEPDDDAKPWQGGGCEIVAGAIRAVDVCDQFAPSQRREARRQKKEDSAGTDHQFPTPVDAWQTTEDEDETEDEGVFMSEDEQEAWPASAWRHAEAAVDALHSAGWRPVSKQALRWQHPKLKDHTIEIARGSWTHSVGGVVQHAGGHHQLAQHVRDASKVYGKVEAARNFNQRYYRD